MAKGEEDVEMEDASSGSGSDSGSSEDESESKSNDGDEVEDGIGVHDGDESESDSENSGLDEEEHDSDATPVKPELPTPDAGTTLFVRNVPFTATEDELRTLFRTFGPLRYARITMDPETGRSRGTGFACFWNKEDADKVIEQSDLLKSETGLTEAPKQNPFKLPSILTPDPSSSLARSLVLQGRTLDVVRAVTRDKAGKLKEEGEKRREKADKRNVYLLREGVILPSSPAAETLTPAELERRSSSFNARKALLKSNPSLYISKTRLSIRQIPTFVTERLLRRLSIHAVKTFNAEVKSRERKGLTEDELHVQVDENGDGGDGDDKNEEGTKGKNKKRFDRKTGVLQAKLVRQKERVDPVTGKGRSKGYGFIEMYTHADALRVLRWSNNNPQAKPDKDGDRIKRIEKEIEKGEGVGGGDLKKAKGRLIVEFSIENVQVVQRRKSMQEEHKKTGPSGKPDSRKEKAKAKAEKEDLLKKEESVSAPSPKKKRKLSRGSESGKEEGAGEVKTKPKLGESAGFFIGRKRKERKMGKKN
ncbi:hypothetical protein D9757_004059 [Collybiopsis confluens]|uniref:RRM domain-containing protein n=1 Tax=Collybiopsis confluens TaxID=2823264 RepID=A0A8H5HWV0_9AGAR|nr:hypothetical protein D9757_004059 [Collybiopsis confluens]